MRLSKQKLLKPNQQHPKEIRITHKRTMNIFNYIVWNSQRTGESFVKDPNWPWKDHMKHGVWIVTCGLVDLSASRTILIWIARLTTLGAKMLIGPSCYTWGHVRVCVEVCEPQHSRGHTDIDGLCCHPGSCCHRGPCLGPWPYNSKGLEDAPGQISQLSPG